MFGLSILRAMGVVLLTILAFETIVSAVNVYKTQTKPEEKPALIFTTFCIVMVMLALILWIFGI